MSRWILRFAQNDRLGPWACCALIVAATLASYCNSLHGPFVFDDASSIVTNPTIQKLGALGDVLAGPVTNVTAQGRPVLNLSLAINYALGGAAVEGYHIGNLLIHTLAALTLFGIVRRTLRSTQATWLALAIAVLWAVHPLQTESVTYTIQRAESLVGLFYLLTLYCFVRAAECNVLRYTPRAARWQGAAVAACLLGMATKEVMATAPLMILFFDRTFFAGTFLAALRRRSGFYAALASTWLLLAWLVGQTGGNRGGSVGFGVGVAWWEYWLTQLSAIPHYLWLSIWPHPLVFEYGAFWIRGVGEIAAQALIVLGLLAGTIVALWRRSALGFAGAWFFGILAPTSLAPGTTQMIVEHRMYLPLAAVIAVGVVALHACLARYRPAAWLGAAGVALALLTVDRNADYRSDLVLWSDTIAKRPENPLAHFMLAGAQERAGQLAAAQASYERTLQLKPDFSIGHEHFGEFLFRAGRRTEAIEHFAAALQLQPDYADAHANLGNALLAGGRTAEAAAHLRQAAQLAPYAMTPEAHFNLANALMELGQAAEAITHYEAAIQARPAYSAAHYNLGNALAASGRPAEAVPHYEAALRARPDYPEAHHNLASALFETGHLPEAAQHYEETLRLAPNFPNARANLDRVRAQMGQR